MEKATSDCLGILETINDMAARGECNTSHVAVASDAYRDAGNEKAADFLMLLWQVMQTYPHTEETWPIVKWETYRWAFAVVQDGEVFWAWSVRLTVGGSGFVNCERSDEILLESFLEIRIAGQTAEASV